jgi:phosphatidylglycerophosphatase A
LGRRAVPTPALPRSRPAWWISCAGGIGLAPKAPGTWGSLVALPPSYLIATLLAPGALLIAALAVTAIGYAAVRTYLKHGDGREDPQEIVIDEVAGQMLALSLLPPHLWAYAGGFLLFRLFDIVKPFPAGLIDARIGGALGVMLDDTVAGVYALVAMLVVVALAGQFQL